MTISFDREFLYLLEGIILTDQIDMGIIFYSILGVGLGTILIYGIAFILKKNSPYKNSEWINEHNKRILEKYQSDILRYDVLLRINQNALTNTENESQKAHLSQQIKKFELQKEKFLKSIGYLSESEGQNELLKYRSF